MGRKLVGGIETGGTKILARICDPRSGEQISEGRWPTDTAQDAADVLVEYLSGLPEDMRPAAIGMAAFGPLVVDPHSTNYGRMLATPKPGWADSNLRAELEARLDLPVAVDTDVNAAAIAEQKLGAGEGLPSIAYVTVGTGIGAGLAIRGHSLKGALHPEAGHIRLVRHPHDDVPSSCPFHADCAEGLASGPAVRRRLGDGQSLADAPAISDLIGEYLGQLAAAVVLTWSPHRIVWGGGVIGGAPLIGKIEKSMVESLGGYGVGSLAGKPGFCVEARLEDAGLEGALLMAARLVDDRT